MQQGYRPNEQPRQRRAQQPQTGGQQWYTPQEGPVYNGKQQGYRPPQAQQPLPTQKPKPPNRAKKAILITIGAIISLGVLGNALNPSEQAPTDQKVSAYATIDRQAAATFTGIPTVQTPSTPPTSTPTRPPTSTPTSTPTPTPIQTASPAPIVTPASEVLKSGDSGNQVAELQNALIGLGYLEPGQADGDYGGKTRAAVKAFQKENGLSADGVAGAKTLALVYSGMAKARNADTKVQVASGTSTKKSTSQVYVWIPTKGGAKYHRNSTCSGMKSPKKVTLEDAKKKGFKPCGSCNPPK